MGAKQDAKIHTQPANVNNNEPQKTKKITSFKTYVMLTPFSTPTASIKYREEWAKYDLPQKSLAVDLLKQSADCIKASQLTLLEVGLCVTFKKPVNEQKERCEYLKSMYGDVPKAQVQAALWSKALAVLRA